MEEEKGFDDIGKRIREMKRETLDDGKTKNGVCKLFLHSECKRTNCPFDHDLTKVAPCNNFSKNLCKYGDQCDFSHRETNKNEKTCKFLSNNGFCDKETCKFRHALEPCPLFDRGFCLYGRTCLNVHVRKKICYNYMLGFCPNGPECKNAHPKILCDSDEKYYKELNPTAIVIKCHKCQVLGHKSTQCTLNNHGLIDVASCANCKKWHDPEKDCELFGFKLEK
mmetsp:Transcript_70466/g.82099  ORF Transcript_70466/g.82099 Transcript_70466/m.82099 type:complete len:223 (+) Transcript_70466:32-700(+)